MPDNSLNLYVAPDGNDTWPGTCPAPSADGAAGPHTNEAVADPLEIRIYGGQDARFVLYEDDGATYGYERGECSAIELAWNDRAKTLAVGDGKGAYPGMLKARTFQVVLVSEGQGTGVYSGSPEPYRKLCYKGIAATLRFDPCKNIIEAHP